MKIQVTQEDINNGIPKQAHHCPIACAIKRIIPNLTYVGVVPNRTDRSYGYIGIRIRGEDGGFKNVVKNSFQLSIPDNASSFANDFDEGKKVAPFEFELNYEN